MEPAELMVKNRSRLLRAARAAAEEVGMLRPPRMMAELATYLPRQAFSRTRTGLLRMAGARIGVHSLVLGPFIFTGDVNPCRFLTIGENTIITGPLHADLGAELVIGDWVRIGLDVSFLTIDHEIGSAFLRSGTSRSRPIRVGDGAWIASRVTVLGGVTIGASAVVAAGSVVTRDVAPNTLVAGVPARLVRELG